MTAHEYDYVVGLCELTKATDTVGYIATYRVMPLKQDTLRYAGLDMFDQAMEVLYGFSGLGKEEYRLLEVNSRELVREWFGIFSIFK